MPSEFKSFPGLPLLRTSEITRSERDKEERWLISLDLFFWWFRTTESLSPPRFIPHSLSFFHSSLTTESLSPSSFYLWLALCFHSSPTTETVEQAKRISQWLEVVHVLRRYPKKHQNVCLNLGTKDKLHSIAFTKRTLIFEGFYFNWLLWQPALPFWSI